jgi:hypothetical protein
VFCRRDRRHRPPRVPNAPRGEETDRPDPEADLRPAPRGLPVQVGTNQSLSDNNESANINVARLSQHLLKITSTILINVHRP